MKIGYLIRTYGHNGIGGHYHSLRTTAEALSSDIDSIIINIGKFYSPVIKNSSIKSFFVYTNGYNILKSFYEVYKICKQEKITLLHSFDESAFLFGRVASFFLKLPHVLTKCGGPNSKYYPKLSILICYSKENFNYYKNHNKFQFSKVFLIPNRVSSFSSDNKLVKEIKDKYIKSDEIVFLRIARIGQFYEKGFYQILDFIKKLNENKVKAKLIIVGQIENQNVYNKLLLKLDNNVILTDEKYTSDAKKIIEIADVIIGTGRGVMEASSKGKIIMVTSDNTDCPILLDKNNFNILFEANFSSRIKLNKAISIQKTIDLLRNKKIIKQYENFSMRIFNEYFNINSVKDKYIEIYTNAKYNQKIYILDFMEHLFRNIRNLLRQRY